MRGGEHEPHPEVLGDSAGGGPLTTPSLGKPILNQYPTAAPTSQVVQGAAGRVRRGQLSKQL